MAFTFGDVFVLMGIVGVLGIAGAFLSKWAGITDAINVITNFWNGFTNIMGRILSFAPKPLQILFFLLMGTSILGVAFSWIVAGDMVCDSCKVYQAPSYVMSTYTRFTNPDDGQICNMDGSTSVDPHPTTSKVYVGDNVETLLSFGTFYTAGDSTVPVVQAGGGVQRVMALPSSTVVSSSKQSYSFSVCKAAKDTTLNSGAVISQGQCYLGDNEGSVAFGLFSTNCVNFMDEHIAEVEYKFNAVVDKNKASVVTTAITYTPLTQGSVPINLNACPQSPVADSYRLSPGVQDSSSTFVNIPSQFGYVRAVKYVNQTQLTGSTVAMSGGSKRSGIVGDSTNGFVRQSPNPGAFVSYTCKDKNDLAVLIYGLDLFSFQTMAAIIVIGGLLWFIGFAKALFR
jgi:hypothetical protein